MDAQFDKIARVYKLARQGGIKEHVIIPTFLKMLGDVSGMLVLDGGSGSGIFTRLIKDRGARQVIGVDIAPRQVEMAREEAGGPSPGIDYVLDNVIRIAARHRGKFDLVTSVFLLDYAETEKELRAMFQSVQQALKSGGRFVSITHNPTFRFFPGIEYERHFESLARGKIKDGDRIKVEMYHQEKIVCTFFCVYWSRKTYEAAIKAAGFKQFAWMKAAVSPEGYARFGREYWRKFEENPSLIGLVCRA